MTRMSRLARYDTLCWYSSASFRWQCLVRGLWGLTNVHLNAGDLTLQNNVRYTNFVWQSLNGGLG